MNRSRRSLASIIGLGLGLAGCDTVTSAANSTSQGRWVGLAVVHDVALLALAFGVALAVVLTLSITGQAIVHWRLSIALRAAARHAVFAGRSVGVVPGRGIALVAGIRRPATYLSNDVVAVLSADELAAVIAHERHHERARAPFRLIVLAGIAVPLRFIPPIGRWVERARSRIEIEADAAALAEGSSRLAIARAIIKLGHEQLTATGFAPFASSADLRLRALLDAGPDSPRRFRHDLAVGAVLASIVVLACFALLR